MFEDNIKREDFFTAMRSKLNADQYEAATTLDGPVLILAGAGSGKTTTLTWRTANIIQSGVIPENILLLTFTNKAAEEMLERISLMCGKTSGQVRGGTYHAYAANVLFKYGTAIGIDNNFTIMDPSDVSDAISLCRERLGYGKIKQFPKPKEIDGIFSSSINNEWTIQYILENFYPQYTEHELVLEAILDEYRRYKKQRNILDYDDLLVRLEELLTVRPDICQKLSDAHKYIMVDEYQDTNIIQFRIIKKLRSFDNKNVCVVGDDMQSIYMFRGARFENIITFPDEFEGCKKIILKTNYRSNQEIVDLSNGIIDNAEKKFEKELRGLKSCGRKPILIEAGDSAIEAATILDIIESKIRNGVSASEIAVIAKSSFSPYSLEAELVREGIPYIKYGGLKFFDRKFVKDILTYLRLTVNEADEIAWFRILQLYEGVGPAYAKKIMEKIMKNGIDELISPAYTKYVYGNSLKEVHEIVSKLKTMELNEQIDYLINEYYFELMTRIINNSNSTELVKRTEIVRVMEEKNQAGAIRDIAAKYKTTQSFLIDMVLEPPKNVDDATGCVTVTTIHSVKGLEFGVVILMDCREGTLPWKHDAKSNTRDALEKEHEEIEEERRCFYVGVTRAKDELFVTYPLRAGFYGEPAKRSRFLDEGGLARKYFESPVTKNRF